MPQCRFRRSAPLVLLTLLVATAPAAAQTQTLDEGAFRLLVNGEEEGRETFSIRQNGTGASAVIIAQGRVVRAVPDQGDEIAASLELTGAFRPTAYQITVRGAEPQRIAGRLAGGRFSARIVSAAGEMMREYLAGDDAILVDEGLAHHYYFVALRAQDTAVRLPVIVPRQSQQITIEVAPQEASTLAVEGHGVAARRLLIRTPEGERHLWVDERGRVLRLEIPARGFVAQRVSPPA